MSNINANSKVVEISFEAVKITADGRRIPLGTLDYYHRNPLRRFVFWLKKRVIRRRYG